MSGTRLGGLDTAFLCLEDADHPLQVGGMAIFTPTAAVSPWRLVDVLTERAARIPRLRERVVLSPPPPWGAHWVAMPSGFDPRRHIRTHVLTGGDRAELNRYAAAVIAEPLRRDRPLWRVHVVTGLAEGDFAVIVVLHHAMADGAKAIMVGLGLLDHAPPAADLPVVEDHVGSRGVRGTLLAAADRLIGATAKAAAVRPPDLAREARRAAGVAAAVANTAWLLPPRGPLLAAPSPRRAVATATLAMDQVRGCAVLSAARPMTCCSRWSPGRCGTGTSAAACSPTTRGHARWCR
ncbi:wax ester/triacylglycerol synthase domain-containing protein [Actinokineospora sp. HUAS TT18]|uniref:wax ester/triacylglycerol synthase domain-containing protein n=1 Tax=Actinokineospora sp. HUAS TT18 TaxID=3447451 RepID=UPI003F51E4BD